MKPLLTAFAALLLALPVWAIDIDQKNRVPNRNPGYCAWASLETLGRHHKVKPLFNLVEKRTKDADSELWTPFGIVILKKNLGYEWAVRAKLDSLGVNYKYQSWLSYDRKILKKANKYGLVVGFHPGTRCKGAHACVLTYYDDEKVEFYDPNYPDDIWQATRGWFDQSWDGSAILVYPK